MHYFQDGKQSSESGLNPVKTRDLSALRSKFDDTYDTRIVGAGFVESDEYYRLEKERYWRSLLFFSRLDVKSPAKILEIGGGQLALLASALFKDDCSVADISDRFAAPIRKAGLDFFQYDLTKDNVPAGLENRFETIFLLEVIEHIPLPAYVVFKQLRKLLCSGGVLFITTPNLFRLRNLVKMFLGQEFLDHFESAGVGRGLGHQLEYTAGHMRWQFQQADMEVIMLEHDELGHEGHSATARFGRKMLAPLRLRPIWRDELVVAARKLP
jgi:2-polyprenyl-3-methyl-5-hydroxy-6-metoxy-1,4-benzoquinol methylase